MAPKKPSKPIYKTSSPFTETKWPYVSHEDQEVLRELLCNLLTPLGEHRETQIQPSKGKKRKRNTGNFGEGVSAPPKPAIASHILIGLNSVTRHLELLAANSAPATAPVRQPDINDKTSERLENGASAPKPLSMVILMHPQPALSPSHAHIPTLLHLATRQPDPISKADEPTRLIALPTSDDARFASALRIPRVGAIGVLEGAPGAKALEDYVRQHVGVTECLWVDEALQPEWRGLTVVQA